MGEPLPVAVADLRPEVRVACDPAEPDAEAAVPGPLGRRFDPVEVRCDRRRWCRSTSGRRACSWRRRGIARPRPPSAGDRAMPRLRLLSRHASAPASRSRRTSTGSKRRPSDLGQLLQRRVRVAGDANFRPKVRDRRQVLDLVGPVRLDGLRRVRPLHRVVPGRHRRARGAPGDRSARGADAADPAPAVAARGAPRPTAYVDPARHITATLCIITKKFLDTSTLDLVTADPELLAARPVSWSWSSCRLRPARRSRSRESSRMACR